MGSNILAQTTGTITEIEKGEKGAIERPRNWDDIADGSSLESGSDGEKWLDIVLYGDNWYQCITSFAKGNGVVPTNTIYFKNITDYKRLATSLFLASKAYIHNLGVDNILITDQGEGKGNVLLKADKDGIECKSGKFEDVTIIGSMRSPFISAGNTSKSKLADNMSLVTNGGDLNATIASVDISQVGRVLHFTHYKWNSTLAENGNVYLKVPSGYYIYEDGLAKSQTKLSRECLTLLGIGDDQSFFGWAVIGRHDIYTNFSYGHNRKLLAYGTVTGTTSSASIRSSSFDGSALSVKRFSTGVYGILIPKKWFQSKLSSNLNLDAVFVMATGVGYSYDDSKKISPIKATFWSVAEYSLDATKLAVYIHTSDDETVNDGSFNFEISNFNDFEGLNS